MAPDAQRTAETRDWLAKAREDLDAAEALLALHRPLAGVAAFHCQQAAEKAMKAFLAWNDRAFRKTHELEELARQCSAIEPGLQLALEPSIDLTPFAWRFRYPGEPLSLPFEEAMRALHVARQTLDAVLRLLPEAVRD